MARGAFKTPRTHSGDGGLVHAAVRHLHEHHHQQISGIDLRWLVGFATGARRGTVLSQSDIARASAIRGRIAREYHRG